MDASDRRPLKDATVFEVENKKAAITSEKGSYMLVIPSGKKIRGLAFCKAGYATFRLFHVLP